MYRFGRYSFWCFILAVQLLINATYEETPASKREALLEKKLNQLMDLSAKRAVIRLDTTKFNSLVKTAPRNYSTIVMFTALQSHRECGICREASSEFDILANSWRFTPSFSNKVFFAMVDFDDGPEVFNALGLNSAPIFIHFPATGKHKKSDVLDINRLNNHPARSLIDSLSGNCLPIKSKKALTIKQVECGLIFDAIQTERVGFEAEAVGKFVLDKTSVLIEVSRPFDYYLLFAFVVFLLVVAYAVYIKRDNLEFFQNKNAWAFAALSIILWMTSGQMWNAIRGTPFSGKGQNGRPEYIHPWSDSQFIAESYIVIALNSVVVIGMILLSSASSVKQGVGKKRVMSLCGISAVVVFFSLLLSVFRSKHQGYPYSFLFS